MDRLWAQLAGHHFKIVFNDGAELDNVELLDHDNDASWFIIRVSGGDRFKGYEDAESHEVVLPGWNIAFMLPTDDPRLVQ